MWQNPSDPGLAEVRVLRDDAPCPTDPASYQGFLVGTVAFTSGPATFSDANAPAGPHCYQLSFARDSTFQTPNTVLIQVGSVPLARAPDARLELPRRKVRKHPPWDAESVFENLAQTYTFSVCCAVDSDVRAMDE